MKLKEKKSATKKTTKIDDTISKSKNEIEIIHQEIAKIHQEIAKIQLQTAKHNDEAVKYRAESEKYRALADKIRADREEEEKIRKEEEKIRKEEEKIRDAKREEEEKKRKEEEKKRKEENDKSIKELRRQLGGISAANGEMAEENLYNALKKTKSFAKIKFNYIRRNVNVVAPGYETVTEIDILMVNGDSVFICEAKYKVTVDDVFELLNEKLPLIKQYLTDFHNHKIYLGIGGMSFKKRAENFARKNGIGIIKMENDVVEYDYKTLKNFNN